MQIIEAAWNEKQANYFNAASGYYALRLLDDAEKELNKIDRCFAAQSVAVLALRLEIAFSRNDWSEMQAIARKLFQLDRSNPYWPFCDGFATAKVDSAIRKENQATL